MLRGTPPPRKVHEEAHPPSPQKIDEEVPLTPPQKDYQGTSPPPPPPRKASKKLPPMKGNLSSVGTIWTQANIKYKPSQPMLSEENLKAARPSC